MIIKFFTLILFVLISSHALAIDLEFTKKANELAELEKQQSKDIMKWRTTIQDYLSEKTKKSSVFDVRRINSPQKYYDSDRNQIELLKEQNTKLVEIEKIYSRNKYIQDIKKIKRLRQELANSRQKMNAENIKNLIIGFHNNQINLLPHALDHVIGIEYEKTESMIKKSDYSSEDAIVGSLKILSQTGYDDLMILFNYLKLNKNDVFYDFGSGYGRIGFYGGILNPQTQFKGIEFVQERVSHTQLISQKLNLANVKFTKDDVLIANYDDGTIFYLFNPFPKMMESVLAGLKKIAMKKTIKIVSLGYSTTQLARIEWLEIEKDLRPARKHHQLIVFKSKFK